MITSLNHPADWGFYGHRLINEMAVYTLPPELQVIFKPEIQYITEHAVDADKRRYAVPSEGFHHYIDLDHYGEMPYSTLPRRWDSAVIKYSQIIWVLTPGDTIRIKGRERNDGEYESFIRKYILPRIYSGDLAVHCDTFRIHFGLFEDFPCQKIIVVDSLSCMGDLPYHLIHTHSKLTNAFKAKDLEKIIRISADLGHYIADAHVPLHTTSNYDGQLTGQQGIHAFWESRLPELFADREYDFFVGKAAYIQNVPDFFWDVVLNSHLLVKDVLAAEARVRKSYPAAYQFCFEDRLNQTVRTPCSGFARAFHQELRGMVEKQMRRAIKAVADCWYTAWVEAGQPDFSNVPLDKRFSLPDQTDMSGSEGVIRKGNRVRAHE